MNEDAYLSTRDVAQMLHTSVPTVTRLVRSGDLPAALKAPGARGAYLFDRGDIETFAAERAS